MKGQKMTEEYGKLVQDLFKLVKTEDLPIVAEILKELLDLAYKDQLVGVNNE